MLWTPKRKPEKKWDPSMPSRGLGDTVAKITHALGIHPAKGCGCHHRQAKLNRLLPYRPEKG